MPRSGPKALLGTETWNVKRCGATWLFYSLSLLHISCLKNLFFSIIFYSTPLYCNTLYCLFWNPGRRMWFKMYSEFHTLAYCGKLRDMTFFSFFFTPLLHLGASSHPFLWESVSVCWHRCIASAIWVKQRAVMIFGKQQLIYETSDASWKLADTPEEDI